MDKSYKVIYSSRKRINIHTKKSGVKEIEKGMRYTLVCLSKVGQNPQQHAAITLKVFQKGTCGIEMGHSATCLSRSPFYFLLSYSPEFKWCPCN